ncbi:hypothetical protein G9P44_001769 [Scheffersomyces stipitis]|nr:hypothetical protein G9P44_001769 [Scheffersomyces stipitis]
MSGETPVKPVEVDNDVEALESAKELSLKIDLPACLNAGDSLSIPSNYDETINDLKQALSLLPLSRSLTNYTIYINGTNVSDSVDDLTTFSQLFELFQWDSVDLLKVTVKERAYTLAAVYEQISRFREIIGLHYVDRMAEDLGVASGVSRLNELTLNAVKERENQEEKDTNEKSDKDEKSEETEETFVLNEEDIKSLKISAEDLSSTIDIDLAATAASFNNIHTKIKLPIKSLTISQWSPVPAFQKNKGDLLYLTLQTLENETFNITCHFSGFFVNRSSTVNFNPEVKVNEKGQVSKNFLLVNLVDSLSPSFSKVLEENELSLSTSSEHPETYLLPNNSFLATPWYIDTVHAKNYPDVSRSQLPLILNGVDGSDYVKDWNEDFQSVRELPNTNIQERILREKLIQKALFDFTKTATDTSVNIIKGNLTPMNPNEEEGKHIYLKNGIFYASDATSVEVFEATGAEEAARYVASKDLAGVKVLNKADVPGVNNLVTCIVDYLGKRIVCQAPVPGIFNAAAEDEEEKVVYGLSTDGSTISQDKSFEEPLKQIAEVFHLKPHTVEVSDEIKSESELLVSKDTKGIKGTDSRKYVIDLYRTTPRDIQFTEAHFDASNDTSYPHGESLLRHEAVAEWWKRKVSALFKAETEKLEKEGKMESKDGEKPQIVLPTDQVVFNPDAFSFDSESDEDREVVRNLSKFVKEKLIEEFLTEFPSQVAPFDGQQLTSILHRQGINMRYLGYIAEQALLRKQAASEKLSETVEDNLKLVAEAKEKAKAKAEAESKEAEAKKESDKKEESKEGSSEDKEEDEQTKATYEPTLANYDALYRVTVQEMIARAAKHLLRKLSADVPVNLFASFVAHFHNCLLGAAVNAQPAVEIEELYRSFYPESAFNFTKLNSDQVIALITKEVFLRFRYALPEDWSSVLIHPIPLMREIALKFGIQWKAQKYVFTAQEFAAYKEKFATTSKQVETAKSKKKGKKIQVVTEVVSERDSIFVADDIVNFVPIVKDSSYKASLIDEIFQSARSHIASGEKDVGLSIFNELVAIQEQIYGRVNSETARFYTLLAQVYSELGYQSQAAFVSRKAIILSERTTGFDSYDTITAYLNSGFYEAANFDLINSVSLYNQAVATWTSVYGKGHPTLINTLTNIAENYSRASQNESAIKLLESALEFSKLANGEVSEITGIVTFRLANCLINTSKFDQSLELYRACEATFEKVLGPDDALTKQASKYVSSIETYVKYMAAREEQRKRELAQQAVASGNSKIKVKSQTETVKNGKKNGKKSAIPQPDPEIASKSIDDILQFIEGNNPKKSSKKSKKSKK